uniref:CEP63/Deup1 CEP152 binding coiled coil domain-containing protein n=1 Tax=Junco hyemalis TaxID=40217 RepID=A0A8C5JSI6_JUNHY
MEADISDMRNELHSRDESLVQLEELVSWKQQQKKSLISKEQSHCSEQERMKTEISDLTEELHQKEITIATIMEKATLLERQLKMELETKHKLLTKQQVYLCNKEHGNFTASVHKMKHENLRLQNSLVKPQNDTGTSILSCMDLLVLPNHDFLFIAQSPPEMSFLATAEKFLQEEEKHAREFEERLNSHLEELQRYSENTLKKYARMQQSRRT